MSAGGGELRDAHPEDAGAYVLGALADDEHARFQEHMRGCAACREEVARLQVVADALPLAAPQLSAPPELRARVVGALGGQAAGAPSRVTRRGRGAAVRRGTSRRWSLGAVGALAAVAIVLAVIALAQPGGSSSRTVRAQVSAAGASASLQITGDRGELQISGMPQAPPRHTYEVWVERAGAPQPTDSLFTVSSSGRASVGVPGSLTGVRAVLVTAEPLGGSRVPSAPPILVARVG